MYIKKRGITLIEALFVLGILAIIIGMVMVFLSKASDRMKVNELKNEMLQVAQTARDLSSSNPDITGITPQAILVFLPAKYNKNGTIVNPYGTSIDINVMTYAINGVQGTYLHMWINNLTKSQCVSIATTDFSSISMSLNVNWSGDTQGMAYTPQQAGTYCADTADNQIGFNLYDGGYSSNLNGSSPFK